QLEGHAVQLGDHRQDVLGRALERGPHRVQLVADPVLRGEPALDLGDVLAGARVRAAQADHGEICGRHGPYSPSYREGRDSIRLPPSPCSTGSTSIRSK